MKFHTRRLRLKPRPNQGGFSNKSFWSEYYIIPVLLGICAIGIITAGSAIQTRTFKDSQLFADEFFKQILSGFILGIFLAYSTYIIGIERILKFKRVLLGLSLLTLLYLALPALISFFTKQDLYSSTQIFSSIPIRPVLRNAAVRWISFFGLQFQPVELVKLTLLIYLADYFKDIDKQVMNWDYYKRALYVFLASCFFIIIQPDLGSVVIITMMITTVLYLIKINTKQMLVIISILAIFSSAAILLTPYRRERFIGWLSNSKIQKQVDADYAQIERVQEAVVKGGLFGVGYTKGEIKRSIPEVSSDAVLAVMAEEFGFISIIILVSLYCAIFYYCITQSQNIQNNSKKIIIIGVGSWIFFQAIWNISGVIGMVPLKGLPLPFVSEGGTSVAVSILGVGLIFASLKKDFTFKRR